MNRMYRIRRKLGQKYVGTHHVVHSAPGIVIIEIDMHLKRAEIDLIGTGGGDFPPSLLMSAGDDSYFKGEPLKVGQARCTVEFPGLLGWRIYMAERIGRYEVAVVLMERKTK